ncbi:Ubiquitin carboxyl-terminal hydrolase [Mycena sanguinolenta]|uniref:Ubiquitin carboxyl-terminal hydrolase n=1 Tax=Mycena sanguinolenta TaxID=230812 RepID=A0A8H6ZC95_9AGAR|nr:Ubiquitin carboxyl-terminal hydrolase [Mycena sanguinolenta]
MQILNEVSASHRASKAPPLVSVSHSTASSNSSKKHDGTERVRSSSRPSSSSSTPSTITAPMRAQFPSPSNTYYPYYPYIGQASQSRTTNPCSILSGGPPPVHRLPQGRIDLPSSRFARSSPTHWPAPAPARASNWEDWGSSQEALTLPSTSSRRSMSPPDGIPASAATWFAPSSFNPIQAKPIPDRLPHYGSDLPPVTPFIPPLGVPVEAWEEEFEACEHILMLQQTAVGAIPASRLAHCVACELTSNLWLCLTCGLLGCGRRQRRGGNGHALNHFEQTGHPISLKLGTVTPEGRADIWCHKCFDFMFDPALAEHLSVFGIDVKTARKTDKTTAEIMAEIRAEDMVLYPYPCLPAWATQGPSPPVAPRCATPSWSEISDTPPIAPSQVPQMGYFPGISAPRMGVYPYDPWGSRKHPRFWYADGDRQFIVENTEYQLHRYLFSKAATPPRRLFLTESKLDFDRFLSILYPTNYSTHECKTAEEWTSVLRLADKWGMQDIRRLSIAQLTLCAGPVDKIALGHQYKITEWLGPAYLALVTRKQSITAEEGAKLGVEALVRIRALGDEVFNQDRTKYINEKLFYEAFATKLAV